MGGSGRGSEGRGEGSGGLLLASSLPGVASLASFLPWSQHPQAATHSPALSASMGATGVKSLPNCCLYLASYPLLILLTPL